MPRAVSAKMIATSAILVVSAHASVATNAAEKRSSDEQVCQATARTDMDVPAILLTQVGFAPQSRKIAILRTNHAEPTNWVITNATGETVLTGETIPAGQNDTSGDEIHRIDLSGLTVTGDGYRIKACNEISRSFPVRNGQYLDIAYDTLRYFYHNRSGEPILAEFSGGEQWARPESFTNNTIASCFTGKDLLGKAWPACDYKLDVTGGWFDAGDFGKYVVNGGITVWTLQDTYERFPELWSDGNLNIPESGNGFNDLLDEARQGLEFLLAMQIPEGRLVNVARSTSADDEEIIAVDGSGLVHHKTHAAKWPGFPKRPETSNDTQYLYPPSTAATLNLAASAAQGARLWQTHDPVFSARALTAARHAFDAALREPNLLAIDRFDGGGAYGDQTVDDEFSWAAAELFATTGDAKYLKHVLPENERQQPNIGLLGWSNLRLAAAITILRAGNRFPQKHHDWAAGKILQVADHLIRLRDKEGYAFPLSKDGYTWGSSGRIANNAMILAMAYDMTNDRKYRDTIVDAMDYLLGRNAIDQSYISGFGVRSMENPHHRFWGHSLDPALPAPPPGAVSGGPNNRNFADTVAKKLDPKCPAQTCWRDDAHAFSLNEVAINWNAPVAWIASYLHATETLAQ